MKSNLGSNGLQRESRTLYAKQSTNYRARALQLRLLFLFTIALWRVIQWVIDNEKSISNNNGIMRTNNAK